jgi:molecular chaperone HscB
MLDPFTLLDLPHSFDLESCVLRGALLKGSLRWHPDRFALASEGKREEAERRMAELNDAHAQLVDPLHRAEALLALHGQALGNGTDRTSSPAFLMEMMELKEEAEAAFAGGDDARLQQVLARLREDEHERIVAITRAFREWEAADRPDAALQGLRGLVTEAVYVRRTLEGIRPVPAH